MTRSKRQKQINDNVWSLLKPGPDDSSGVHTYSVSELSQELKHLVRDTFGQIRIRGEISEFSKSEAGHYYFRLKDESSVIQAVCWCYCVDRLRTVPEDGLEVLCIGSVTIYEKRSQYQITVTEIELAGQGALLKQIEDRRRRLASEGLFDEDRKQSLPFLPDLIGVITSPRGAVIHDIIDRLTARFPRRVLLWPVTVEGRHAAGEIVAGIEGFGRLSKSDFPGRPDVIIVARGGGSVEDLMPFNEEIVVRAAAASSIPLISAIGHETDVTLLDHVADRRAPTPTAAAELVVPVRADLIDRLFEIETRVRRLVLRYLEEQRSHVAGYTRGLRDPQTFIDVSCQRLDDFAIRLSQAGKGSLRRYDSKLRTLHAVLRCPRSVIEIAIYKLSHSIERFTQARKTSPRCYERQLSVLQADLSRLSGHFTSKAQYSFAGWRDRFFVVTQDKLAQYFRLKERMLCEISSRLDDVVRRGLHQTAQKLSTCHHLLESLSYKEVLKRGYVVVRDDKGGTVTSSVETTHGQKVTLTFHDGVRGALIEVDKHHGSGSRKISKRSHSVSHSDSCDDLFGHGKR